MEYSRGIEEIENVASKWWPDFLSSMEANTSIIPKLLETRDQFVSVLKLSGGENPFSIFDILEACGLPGNLFLKHLVVLSDVGGEQLGRINSNFDEIFTRDHSQKKRYFEFVWSQTSHLYEFQELPVKSLTNGKLKIDGKGLLNEIELSPLHKDVAALLLFGAANTDSDVAETTLAKCEIGTMLGRSEEIDKYVSQKYLWVSRITGGAQANSLGQSAQTFVVETLRESLGSDYSIIRNGKVDVETGRMPFDIVVSKDDRHVGIEISFQVTTNSTIERKANEALNRARLMHKAGHSIAYIIDGAGNFQRRSAVSKICASSDCTVAYTLEEFEILASFIKASLG